MCSQSTKIAVAALIGLALSAAARATVTISSTAPTVDGADIANMTWTDTATDKTWTDTTNHGQSFTTGSDAAGYLLKAFSLQVNTTSSTDPLPADKVWNIRVVTILPDNLTTSTVALETGHTSTGTWAAGDWFTWTLDTPVELLPNTLYGIDIEMTSGGDWHRGIPYFRYNRSDDVADSYRYTRIDGDPTEINATTGRDRIFHIDIDSAFAQPGDFNSDAQVEQTDLNLLLSNWGSTTVPPEWTANFDGLVDQNELNDLLANWGAGLTDAQAVAATPTVVIPEPATLGLLVLGGLAAWRRK